MSQNADSVARYEWAVRDESGHLHPVTGEAEARRTAARNPKYRIFRRPIADWQPVYQSLAHSGRSGT